MEFDDNYAIINIHVEQEEVNDYGEKYKDYVGYAVTVTLKDFDDEIFLPLYIDLKSIIIRKVIINNP